MRKPSGQKNIIKVDDLAKIIIANLLANSNTSVPELATNLWHYIAVDVITTFVHTV